MARRALNDERQIAGAWWIATDPERRVAGVLERSSAGNGVLRLEDVLVEPPRRDRRLIAEPIPLILGDTGSRDRVSLIGCYESSRWNAEGWSPGPKSQSFGVRYSLVTHVLDPDIDPAMFEEPDPLVYGVWTRLDVLDQWGVRRDFVSEGELERHDDTSYSTTLTVRWPGDVRSDTRLGSITLTTPPTPIVASGFSYRLDINRQCYLDCRLDPALPLSKLHERLLIPLRTFFALATDSQPSFTQLNVSLDTGDYGITDLWCVPGELDANDNARVHTEKEADHAVRRGFFTLRHIETKFDHVMAQWFEIFERLETPISSILAAGDYGSGRLTSDHFQSAAFAAEALHRSLGLVVESVPAKQRADIARRMVDALTAEEREIEWLCSRARTVANPRYEDRLAQLLQRSPIALQQAAGEDFAKRVKRARNYFAHLDDSTLRRPRPDELHRLTSLLVLLMVSQVLHELGLDDIGSRIRYADRFWELQRRGVVVVKKLDDEQEEFTARPADDL